MESLKLYRNVTIYIYIYAKINLGKKKTGVISQLFVFLLIITINRFVAIGNIYLNVY